MTVTSNRAATKATKRKPKGLSLVDGRALDILFLFRFRDYSKKRTIEEHRKVIEAHGWCWWGWWKRQSEDSRSDIWNAIDAEINRWGEIPIGLFDSDRGNVYRAIVAGTIKPKELAEPEDESWINVPEADAEHVPLYYGESRSSRAWLKISRIEPGYVKFFGNYSFTEAPKLRNYEGPTLERFQNKKIMNLEELKAMETTIWRIRPARATDSSEQILLTVKGLTNAISGDVVRCKGDGILHLTDLHFATGSNRNKHIWRLESETDTASHTLVQAVTSAVSKHKIGLVIISGDFTFIGSAEEFNEASAAISHLLKILDLTPDHLIIVPGNHDIRWTVDAVYKYDAEVKRAPREAMVDYKRFYQQLLRHKPNPHLSMGRRCLLPCGLTVEICALNSSSLAQGKNFLAAMGRIDEAGFGGVMSALDWVGSKTFALRMLVIHHHLAVTEDLEPAEGHGQGYGLAVDAVRVQRLAARNGVHLALHGHKHRCFIWRSTVYELPERTQDEYRLGELSIVGGGSAGSTETEASSNYFNLLTIEPGKLTLEMYRSRNTSRFDHFKSWQADLFLSSDSGGLKLGDWGPKRSS